jgi:thrombospondin type 3 repeat protein
MCARGAGTGYFSGFDSSDPGGDSWGTGRVYQCAWVVVSAALSGGGFLTLRNYSPWLVVLVALLIALFVGLGISPSPQADAQSSTTVQLPASADTYLSQNSANTNYGTQTSLLVDSDDPAGTGRDKRTLIKFDLSQIPAGATIQSASLKINVTNASPQQYNIHDLKQNWTETGATWNRYNGSSRWGGAGANSTTSDRGGTDFGPFRATSTGAQTVALNSAGVAKIQEWVNGQGSNYGFLIAPIANTSSTDGIAFSSRESSSKPVLEVTYAGASTDTDGDGVDDSTDNCPDVSNPNQEDFDSDGIGDACGDPPPPNDGDEDGVADAQDNCPTVANPNQEDFDNDGTGDACGDPPPAATPDTTISSWADNDSTNPIDEDGNGSETTRLTYSVTNADGAEYSLNGGAWTAATASPAYITVPTNGQESTLQLRAKRSSDGVVDSTPATSSITMCPQAGCSTQPPSGGDNVLVGAGDIASGYN